MGRIAEVLASERVVDEGAHGVDTKCDPGGDILTAPHFTDPGIDARPLRGDFAALEDSSGSGLEHATGYADVKNPGKAQPGEARIYARDSNGAVVGDVWLKGDGNIVATNAGGTLTLAPDGTLSVGGSTDAVALASVVDAILKAIAAAQPAKPAGVDAGEVAFTAFQLALKQYTTSASKKLKVGG